MKDAIIFDVDGTLANCEHRLHLLPDWNAFFSKMGEDTPNEDICWLGNKIGDISGEDFETFVVSGRPEKYRQETVNWLERNSYYLWRHYHALLMRADGDYRSDVEVKREILKGIQGQGYRVRLVIDDRPQVVDMWRSEGITCLQCAPTESKIPPQKPGWLALMVGPSGSGKTTIVEKTWPKEWVLSSDRLRHELTGDFKDQSRNTDVFKYIHKAAELRLWSGLPVVIDATNIKNADRRAFLDLTPPNALILYHVVNRPMKDKIADAGWRSEVKVKGMSLIEYHEQVFQSNLKDILKGDGDSRVRVIDMREREANAT